MIFFSTTTIEFRGEEHTASVGLLGKVFTVGEADLAKSIGEGFGKPSKTKSNNDWLSTSPSDDSNADNADDTNAESVDSEDEEIVNDVKDVVKKHVKKKIVSFFYVLVINLGIDCKIQLFELPFIK